MVRHPFPGNVRELKNLVERLVILGPDDGINAADVDGAIGSAGNVPRANIYRPGVPFKVLADEAERAIIEEALAHHGRQMTATARALGLERSHLYKKAKALGLRGESDKSEPDDG
jgi:DNA-binding NtrC family response regulator